jgi:hypothetical protein
LRKVPNCLYCGVMRFQYESPGFCCRKGKIKVHVPQVPDELKRLFTSQTDNDAKYFRQNIRYFNSHFSFTSLGVTLDRRVATAAGTDIYIHFVCMGPCTIACTIWFWALKGLATCNSTFMIRRMTVHNLVWTRSAML